MAVVEVVEISRSRRWRELRRWEAKSIAQPGGRPCETNMRAAINAILYLLHTGCPWRYLPRDGFPPRSTFYNIFRNFQKDGVCLQDRDGAALVVQAS